MENKKVMSSQFGSTTGVAAPIEVSTPLANTLTLSIPKCYPETTWDFAECVRRYISEHPEDPNGSRMASSRLRAHEEGKCYSRLNGAQPVFALVSVEDLNWLQGRLLTIVDATFNDREQRRAFKNLVRNTLWDDWVAVLDADSIGSQPALDRE